MNLKKTVIVSLSLVMVSIGAGSALAQNQLGDGRGLDNNLQAGSAGRNSPLLQNTAGRYANALVTGNVAGLGAFRGNVGYGSDYAFRGSLGSDSLYDFNRISGAGNPAFATPGTTGMLNAIINPLRGANDIVLRNSTGYSAGEITGQYTPYGPANSLTGPNARYTNPANLGLSRAISFDQAQAYSSQPLAIGTDANGRQMMVNASPLVGLTIQHSDMAKLARFGGQPNPAQSTGVENRPLGNSRVLPGQAAPLTHEADNADSTKLNRSDARMAPLTLATGERLGMQLAQPVVSQSGAGAAAVAQTATGFDQSLDQLLGSSTAKPGDDVYLDLLKRIRDSAEKQLTPNTQVVPENRLVPLPEGNTSKPTSKPAQGESSTSGATPPGSSAESNSDKTAERPIDRIARKLDYDLPAITTFAGSAQSLYNDAMADAERFMRAERYFDAQTAYNRAIVLQPDKPLAYVGLVNAELGAGLVIPAASALRNLFNAHPELIAARYAQPLLPPEKRLADVVARLNVYLKTDTRTTDGPTLIAYIAYQQRDTQALQSAFDSWAQRDSNDPLLPLLRRIWLSPADPDAPSVNQP